MGPLLTFIRLSDISQVHSVRIRRELGLTFRQSKELLDFLVEKEYLARESRDGNAVRYFTSKEGYCLLYYLSVVHEKLAGFFPQRKGRIFSGLARAEVERELTEMLFSFSPSVSSLNGLSSHNVTTL